LGSKLSAARKATFSGSDRRSSVRQVCAPGALRMHALLGTLCPNILREWTSLEAGRNLYEQLARDV